MRLSWRLIAYACLPGGFIAGAIALAVYLRRRWIAQDGARVDALIAGNAAKLKPGMHEHDEALRRTTEQRREIADRMRRRAAHVESGSPSGEVVRLQERRR